MTILEQGHKEEMFLDMLLFQDLEELDHKRREFGLITLCQRIEILELLLTLDPAATVTHLDLEPHRKLTHIPLGITLIFLLGHLLTSMTETHRCIPIDIPLQALRILLALTSHAPAFGTRVPLPERLGCTHDVQDMRILIVTEHVFSLSESIPEPFGFLIATEQYIIILQTCQAYLAKFR